MIETVEIDQIVQFLNEMYGVMLYFALSGWAYTFMLWRQERRKRKYFEDQFYWVLDKMGKR